MRKVSKDGVITIEEAKGTDTTIVCGRRYAVRSWIYCLLYFVTNTEKMWSEMENRIFLIYDKKISNLKDMLPIFWNRQFNWPSVLVIAEDVDSEALNCLNRLRGQLKICAVKAPDLVIVERNA